MESLFGQLLPDVNLDEALTRQRQQAQPTASHSPTDTASPRSPGQLGISEAVPEEADGFDWHEDVNELADGMASLSVEPRGAGYLGTDWSPRAN